MNTLNIAMLNFMAGLDFNESLKQQQQWGITTLDLKDHVYGKSLMDISNDEAHQVAKSIADHNMTFYCFSTTLFSGDIEQGQANFQLELDEKLERVLELAQILKPKVIRLLAARTSRRSEFDNIFPYILKHKQWLIPLYQAAIDRIHEAGFEATIENEANGCILSKPEEILCFFRLLDRKDQLFFTFDIQNLWQMGVYPSMEVYDTLSHITGYFHLKGSQSLVEGGHTYYASTLEDSSWPVIDITRRAVDSGAIICLNPIKGEKLVDYNYENITKRDIDYLRNNLGEV